MHMTTPPLQPTRAACAIVLSTVITAAIFGLVIVLPAKAETPPIPAHPVASAAQHTKLAGPASSLHRPPLVTRLLTRGPTRSTFAGTEVTSRERGVDGDVLEHRTVTSSSSNTTVETRTVLRHHDTRLVGDQQTGAPGINYGPSRERSLQGRGADTPTSVESFRYGYRLKLD